MLINLYKVKHILVVVNKYLLNTKMYFSHTQTFQANITDIVNLKRISAEKAKRAENRISLT